jgi:hypothetical protein
VRGRRIEIMPAEAVGRQAGNSVVYPESGSLRAAANTVPTDNFISQAIVRQEFPFLCWVATWQYPRIGISNLRFKSSHSAETHRMGAVMPNWMLYCPECKRDFVRSKVVFSAGLLHPWVTGILTFKMTTSGFSLSASSMALAPSTASPHTSKWGCSSSVERTVLLITGWSSAIRIRTLRVISFTLTLLVEGGMAEATIQTQISTYRGVGISWSDKYGVTLWVQLFYG